MIWVAVLLAGYLIGATPFAYLVAKAAAGVDLREIGSHNVGAANVLRHTRWSVGLAALALDMGKGALAAWLGGWLGGGVEGAALGAFTATLGHVYPVWLRFEGGKGVATAAGAFAFLTPPAALATIVAFVVIVWRTRYVSLGSLTGAVLLPILALTTGAARPIVIGAIATAALIVFRHRGNFGRLLSGTERRLGHGE
jgi:glycerol-3-phosphate acyltransferase PlsY